MRIFHPKSKNRGEKNGKWKGGRTVDSLGYILVYAPNHPHCSKKGYVREHRLVMEKKLGRYLLPREDVHHLNYNKQDNRPENLCILTHSQHQSIEGKRNKGKYHRPDISNKKIKQFLMEGFSIRKIARLLDTVHPVILNRMKSL